MNATQTNNMSPEDIFNIREKVLPRRRSIRAIFEPLHRTEVDLRDTSLGSDTEKSQLWSKYPPEKPSTQIMKTKRSCKIGIINCRKGTSGTNSSTSRSKSLASAASKASRPSTSGKNKGKTENVKHIRSKSTGNSNNKRKSVVFVAGDDDGYEPSSGEENDASTAASLLAKLEEMRNKLNERIAKELKLRIPQRKGTNSGGEEAVEDEFPFLLDHNLNFSTSLPPFKPLSIPNKADLGENADSISANKSKRKRDKHLRSIKTPPVPNEREKQFRALYDRIRAHYLIQEEMYKAMTQKDKLEKTINNTIHFEKELLQYLALPDAHPQAKMVLKELRSRRADMVTRLRAVTEPNQNSSRTLTRESRGAKRSSTAPRLPVRSKQKLTSNTNNNAGKLARRKSSAIKSKRSLVNPSKNMIPASLRPKTSKKFSRKSLFKMLDNMIKEAQDREGQNNQGLLKSDFIRMLPHTEEITKHVSKVVTEEQQSQQRLTKRDPRTYMFWLEELVADKIREQRKSLDVHESAAGQRRTQVPPKWTVIASKTPAQDPFGPFKAALNPKDEEPGKRTPLLSRPRPIVKALSKRVQEQLEEARSADRSKLHNTGPTLEAVEKAVRDVIAHQSKFMEQSTSLSTSKNSHNPLKLTKVPETRFRDPSTNVPSGIPHQQYSRPINTIMKPKGTIEEPPSAQNIIHTTNSDMGPPVTGMSQQPPMSRTVTIRPAAAIIAGVLNNPLSAAAKANREQLTGSIPRVVMMPTVTKPDNTNKNMYNKDSDKNNNHPHRPGTTNNIYSSPKSILKPMLPLSTALRVRIPKPAPRLPTTAKTPGPPVPLPNYAQPRFLDQFLNKNETQRLFASGQPDVVSTSVF